MARPSKVTVDYFPCDAVFSPSIQCLETEFGNDGFYFWVKLLQALCRHQYHYIDVRSSNPKRCLFYAKDIGLPAQVCDEMLKRLAEYGSIDQELYNEGIIFSEHFIERIADVYKRRNVELKTKNDIKKELLQQNCDNNEVNVYNNGVYVCKNSINDDINPQIKQNKTKLNENKENEIKSLSEEKITEEEREILKKYIKQKCWANNANAYLHKIIENGDYKNILADIKAEELAKQKKEEIRLAKSTTYEPPEEKELTQEDHKKILEIQAGIRASLKKTMYSTA